jgi:hypothetical protein
MSHTQDTEVSQPLPLLIALAEVPLMHLKMSSSPCALCFSVLRLQGALVVELKKAAAV